MVANTKMGSNKKWIGYSLLGAALLAGSSSVFAGATGNVGAFKTVRFRVLKK